MYDTSVPFENLYGYELGTRVEQELKSLNIQQIKSTNAKYENLRHRFLHFQPQGATFSWKCDHFRRLKIALSM